MTMPYSCDVLLPTAQRYSSLKFRRFAREFDPAALDWADASELVAFLMSVPFASAKYVFQWVPMTMTDRIYRLQGFAELVADASKLHEENLRTVNADDGLAILRAMQDGGFVRGQLPRAVKMAFAHLKDSGASYPEIAKMVGLNLDQVKFAVLGRRARGSGRGTSSLLVG